MKEKIYVACQWFLFADEHICKITTRVAKSNPTLLILIFAFDDAAEQEIKERLGAASNIIYMPRENGDFFLRTVNEFYIGKLAKELISPSKDKTEKKPEKKGR
ncbi:MAG: hypothetical protein IPJ13_00890 [Saprospiraceae bacterium]|nr:hypothetical protein [Saprospiraceae bacterium]